MAEGIAIRVGGREYGGWKTARVTRGIEALSGSFELGVSERWADQDQPWPFGEGDVCTVLVNGEPMITGYVDDRQPRFGPGEHSISVTGRDTTGDAVDSSVELAASEFKNVAVIEIVRKLLKPHGIKVSLQPGLVLPPTTIPKKFSIDPGDTVGSAIENACRPAGVLAIPDGLGNVVLTRAGTERCATALVEGENFLGGSAHFSMKDRFARYVVLGQHKGGDEFNGTSASAVKGTATDLGVPRTSRVLVIRPTGNFTAAQAKTRAEWEATTRAARAATVRVTVQGWTQAGGKVWPVNHLVRVTSPSLGIRGDMLIAQATYALSVDAGATTHLELKRRDAFKPDPTIAKSAGNNYWPEVVKGV